MPEKNRMVEVSFSLLVPESMSREKVEKDIERAFKLFSVIDQTDHLYARWLSVEEDK